MNKMIVIVASMAALSAFAECPTALETEFETCLRKAGAPEKVIKGEVEAFPSLSSEEQAKKVREAHAAVGVYKTMEEMKKAAATAPNPLEAEYEAWMKKAVEMGVCPEARAKEEYAKELERFRALPPEQQKKRLEEVRNDMGCNMIKRAAEK